CPPICTKNEACPMKVTPSSPFVTRRGLWVLPVRGVTAELRTRCPNCCARLRRAGFLNVALIMEPEKRRERPDPSRGCVRQPEPKRFFSSGPQLFLIFYGKLRSDCLTVVTIVISNLDTL